MGVLKGFKNIFIGEDDSDQIDYESDYGPARENSRSSFEESDLSGFSRPASANRPRVKETADPFSDSFTRPSERSSASSYRSSVSFDNFEEEHSSMNMDQMQTLQIVLARPVDFSEVRSIGDDINAYKTVILNLEMVKSDDAKRILDFLSGVAYANKAQIKMMAQKTFAIMSKNVKFDGKDLLTELENNGYSF
ncbi:MAG: cell division protein SepF [Ruminococcus sp.]|nr:cell division protein SepF [Ruminococcus sp.]MBP3797732.1 cell division protein SepF [Ruminococcus sp.]